MQADAAVSACAGLPAPATSEAREPPDHLPAPGTGKEEEVPPPLLYPRAPAPSPHRYPQAGGREAGLRAAADPEPPPCSRQGNPTP